MAKSAVLMEREGSSVIDCLTSRLVCTMRKEGTFSLQLRESGSLGNLRHTVAQRIRCPKKFVNALMSVMYWSDLAFEDYEIADEICERLRALDSEFADAVADDVFLRRLAMHLGNNRSHEAAA